MRPNDKQPTMKTMTNGIQVLDIVRAHYHHIGAESFFLARNSRLVLMILDLDSGFKWQLAIIQRQVAHRCIIQ